MLVKERNNALTISKNIEQAVRIYQMRQRKLTEHQVQEALNNNPLENFRLGYKTEDTTVVKLIESANAVVMAQFFQLGISGFNLDVSEPLDIDNDRALRDTLIKQYQGHGLEGQVHALRSEFTSFQCLMQTYRFAIAALECSQYDYKHATMLMNLHTVLELAKPQRDRILLALAPVMNHLVENQLYEVTPTVIAAADFADILMSCPVVFTHGEYTQDQVGKNQNGLTPNDHVICNRLTSQAMIDVYLLMNAAEMPLSTMTGKDLIPSRVLGMMKLLERNFELTIAATPYLELAREHFGTPRWTPAVDPFLVSYIHDENDYVVVMDRWSAGGILPSIEHLIAGTMEFLRDNVKRLENKKETYRWYFLNQNGELGSNDTSLSRLHQTVTELITAYQQGTMLKFLRGETVESPDSQ